MKKVLIVSSHFPPLNSMAAKRYGLMSKYMEANGYLPYILTQRARGGAYLNYKLDLECPIPEDRIIRIGSLGITYPIEDPVILELLEEYKRQKIFSRVVEEQCLGWFYKVKKELDIEILKDMDIVIGTFPDVGNLFVAGYVAEKLEIPYVAEIRDLISDYREGISRDDILENRELSLERSVLEGAAGIVTVTNGFKKILHERYPEKEIVTVYNGWEKSKEIIHEKNIGIDEEYLYYAGSLYEHRLKSLMLLIDAIHDNSIRIKLKIRSVGPENLEVKLKEYIKNLRMEGQVEVLPPVPENVVKVEQSNAKINLVISSTDSSDKALMTTIPGKVYELINLTPPVLAVTHYSSEISEILARTNKGSAVCEKDDIYEFITHKYEHYVGISAEASFFSRENQAEVLCKFLNVIMEGDCKMKKSILMGVSALSGALIGASASNLKLNGIIAEKQNEKEKFRIMYQLMEKWMRIKQKGQSIETYFNTYEYKNIAIYGLGDIGKLLISDLKDSSVNVAYGIDRNANATDAIKVVSPNEDLENVDVIVVTAIAYFGEVEQLLSEKIQCPVISFEDVIYELV